MRIVKVHSAVKPFEGFTAAYCTVCTPHGNSKELLRKLLVTTTSNPCGSRKTGTPHVCTLVIFDTNTSRSTGQPCMTGGCISVQ
ncbi:hypothetical protein DPMN_021303 [Dreissena polymorpha]|uniref:Uncharacterized protein n=1 Tax=Dreissena polymorpha TaxID=45954 RepID=A0A9D4SAX5_DREPO|nr:hypothetical protein DPMN_021303 [Dreissena polymorpha]